MVVVLEEVLPVELMGSRARRVKSSQGEPEEVVRVIPAQRRSGGAGLKSWQRELRTEVVAPAAQLGRFCWRASVW